MVNIKGFHGTLDEKANKILNSKFIHSSKNSEWLGSGVYFFEKRKDAEWWAKLEAGKPQNQGNLPTVLSADIITEDEFFYDLDFRFNMNKMIEESRDLLEGLEGNLNMNEAEIRCVACNFFAKLYTGGKVSNITPSKSMYKFFIKNPPHFLLYPKLASF